MRIFFCLLLLPLLFNCDRTATPPPNADPVSTTDPNATPAFDFQGHRGARGTHPENSLPGMRAALEAGVNTLEMDVVVTRDSVVILSHEPFMSHEICLDPAGQPIDATEERQHNIYQMTFAETQTYDCGSRVHERFPTQEKLATTKPRLRAVIDLAEHFRDSTGGPPIRYNIEIKRVEGQDGTFHPNPDHYARLLLKIIREKGIAPRTTIQSFDVAALEAAHRQAPDISTAYLIGSEPDFRTALSGLSFSPSIYSPHFELVTPELLDYAHTHEMAVIPWTVNEVADMQRLADMGVDGLISDYPKRFLKVNVEEMPHHSQ